MKRKILMTCEDYLPVIGGAEVCVAALASEYKKRGHEVTVYTNTMKQLSDDTGIVRIPWRFTPGALLRNIRTLWRLIGENDIVHCQYSFRLACLCAPLARMRRKPMILTQQGRGIVPEAHTKLRYALFFKICQWVSMKGATMLTSTSDEITDLTAAFVKRSKILLVSNGFDANRFRPDPSLPVPPEYQPFMNVPRLLTVRRLVPKNGIHILVQALALVRDAGYDFHYFAVGDGRVRPFIEKLIKDLKLEGHITLLDARTNEVLPSYYQHASMVLVPSSAEATSIACIEGMGMGKPLIATRVGGLIDLLGKNSEYGLLIPLYGSSEACNYDAPDTLPEAQLRLLSDAIIAFLKDPQPFQERAAKAQERAAKQFSWSAIADQYLSLYDRSLPA